MLDKLILGTANFTQQYGILSTNIMMDKEEAKKILKKSYQSNISTLDTAFGYGNIFADFLESDLKNFTINTKFSLKDDLNDVYKRLEILADYKIDALLVHDPQNIEMVDKKILQKFVDKLKEKNIIRRIGVSAYEGGEVHKFHDKLYKPDIVQLPLNPLNQHFNRSDFIDYAIKNDIEIHARSLFLQGVLLKKDMPATLAPIQDDIRKIMQNFDNSPSPLSGLLGWANQQNWVHKWVLGVSSYQQFLNIINAMNNPALPLGPFNIRGINHPLTDPRNWH